MEVKKMWIRNGILIFIGIAGGAVSAGGLFSFISSLGVVSDFADRTHTGDQISLYEDAIIVGAGLGNLISIYQIPIPITRIGLGIFGLLAGIFVGCWAMALAEILNVFPIFIRRAKMVKFVSYIILGIALGKGLGTLLFFRKGW